MTELHSYTPGDIIVFRGVGSQKNIWYALPVYVVQDTTDLVAIYWPAGTLGKFRTKPSGEKVTPEAVAHVPMDIHDHIWNKTDVLMLIRPGVAHAIYIMWDTASKKHLCWYCNLQAPIQHTPIGYDTSDNWLDIIFLPDKSAWYWKDADQMPEVVSLGILTAAEAQAIQAEGERVIQLFTENRSPFCDGWENWSPPTEWGIPTLPQNWDLGCS